ncbi:MAG: hypothetical protein AB9891_13235 [Anaerolineaceae bacterium]
MEKTDEKPVIAAQLSSVHSPDEMLQPALVGDYLSKITKEVPLDILILGWDEKPELFKFLTSHKDRQSDQVFLWYPFLSDYPEFCQQHLVENINTGKSKGWNGYVGTGINETFRQACPNNPEAVKTSLTHLIRLLSVYEFDGVFIDKIRFPSMANGLQDVFSCFCPYCVEEAAKTGLDLFEVRRVLKKEGKPGKIGNPSTIPPGAKWLEILISDYPILQQFVHFRVDSINNVVKKIAVLTMELNKEMSLDVFSPCFAPLVGQDYGALAQYAKWLKPMIYRFGNGPSSLKSEIPALVCELSNYLNMDIDETYRLISSHIDGLQGCSLRQLEVEGPLSLIKAEAKMAKELLPETPVYLGLETVYIPGKMEISPAHVQEILEIGAGANVQGYVLSWDLYHTPIENVLPLKNLR